MQLNYKLSYAFQPRTDWNEIRFKGFKVVVLYMNNDFTQFKVMVKPKRGNMVLFPAGWNWLHKGNGVRGKSPKYIVGTLLHYV